jgi:hypothetical protein
MLVCLPGSDPETASGLARRILPDLRRLDTTQIFVPLTEAVESAGALRVPSSKWQVRTAPGIDPDGELTADEEAALFAHYGIDYWPASEPPAKVDERLGDHHPIRPSAPSQNA